MIYLDNASSTQIYPEVLEKMKIWQDIYANPSSNHKMGRQAKVAIEESRQTIAELLGAKPSEIFFTSGGSESNNTILYSAIHFLKIKNFVTSTIEHDSVYETLLMFKKLYNIEIHYVSLKPNLEICYDSLQEILESIPNSFVSLMHVNNEIGNISDIKKIGQLCKNNNAYFHSDCVQSIGKQNLNLNDFEINYISASAHKFHGPRGVGILYAKDGQISPLIYGGAQERNIRAGTENVSAIVGCSEALKMSLMNIERDLLFVKSLKLRIIDCLSKKDFIISNGASNDQEKSIPHILNIGIETNDNENFLIYALDAKNICITASSACSSGVEKKSRVVSDPKISPIRVSLSKFNTTNEVDVFCEELIRLCETNQ